MESNTAVAYCSLELLKNDITLIDKIINENSKNTHEIFHTQLSVMKSIRTDIKSVKSDLALIRETDNTEEITKLEDIVDLTRSILERTDNVIEKLQGFVTILQSQDRLDQMLQGSTKVATQAIESIHDENKSISEHSEIKSELAKNYTIKEQRDFAKGSIEKHSKEKITLF